MVADARPPQPGQEPTDDITLTIHIERPKPGLPDGYISMKREHVTADGIKLEDGADGLHAERTMQHVLIDACSYFRHGQKAKSWVDRIDRNGHDEGRNR